MPGKNHKSNQINYKTNQKAITENLYYISCNYITPNVDTCQHKFPLGLKMTFGVFKLVFTENLSKQTI